MVRLFSLKPLALALSVAFGTIGTAYAADELSLGDTCLKCSPEKIQQAAASEPKIVRSGEPDLPTDYTRVTADSVDGESQVSAHAQGDVIIERNGQVLNSQWADYDQATNTVTAGDNFTFYKDGSTVTGKKIVYDLDKQTGDTSNAHVVSEKNGKRMQSVSEKAEMQGKGRYKLIHTKFNTCEPGDSSWYIKADTVETNEDTGIGVAKHATLVFGGVPILYTPWADFPLNGNRKSGFLVPTVKLGSDGFQLDLPYYLNLAPNYDATITPGIISSRGARIGAQFRYLEPKYSGVIQGTWMPHDKKSEHSNRSQIKWDHKQQITSHLSGGIEFNQVSDNDYYRDFYGEADTVSNIHLNRQAWLNHHLDLWGGSLDSYATVQKYQTLANIYGYKDEPYNMLPRLSTRWQKSTDHAQINVFGQFTRFTSDDKQQGNRLVVYPSVKWNFHNKWGYISPKIGVHATSYDLDSFGSNPSRHINRVLPIFNIDSGMTFERNASLFGNNYVQTLEPRLFYNYIPTRSQNDLPNFDTSQNSFTYEQLFRENLYSGNDRINSANSLSTAIQTRFLNAETGEEVLRAGIGQKFYFSKDNVLLDGSISQYERNLSDWMGFIDSRIIKNIWFDTSAHYDESNKRIEKFSAGIRYSPEPGKVLSARYKYDRAAELYLSDNNTYAYGTLSQLDLAAQWPITHTVYAVGRYNYGLNVRKPIQMLAGLEYKSPCGCWSASVVGERYVTGLNTYKKAIFFNLQLKNLSNLGNNPFEELRLAIPGYSKINEVNTK